MLYKYRTLRFALGEIVPFQKLIKGKFCLLWVNIIKEHNREEHKMVLQNIKITNMLVHMKHHDIVMSINYASSCLLL